MKILLLFIFIIQGLLSSILADVLYLKTGEEVTGNFISSDNRGILFQSEEGTIFYSNGKISRLDMGYIGSSFCMIYTNKQKTCEGIVFSIKNGYIFLGKGKGFLRRESISLKKLLQIELKKIKKNDRIIGIFQEGMFVEIQSSGKVYKGEIISNDGNFKILNLKLKDSIESFFEEDIERIIWNKPKNALDYAWVGLNLTIPGVIEFRKYPIFGSGLGISFLALSAAIPIEYRAAQNAVVNNVDYIPVGRDIWIVTGVDGNPVYEQHRRNYYAAVAGMGLLYAVHGLYLYREHRDGKFPGWNQLELSWSRNPDFSRGGIGQGTNIDLKFSYSF